MVSWAGLGEGHNPTSLTSDTKCTDRGVHQGMEREGLATWERRVRSYLEGI